MGKGHKSSRRNRYSIRETAVRDFHRRMEEPVPDLSDPGMELNIIDLRFDKTVDSGDSPLTGGAKERPPSS